MNSAVASSSVIRRIAVIAAARKPDEPLDLLRHANERVHRLAVFDTREAATRSKKPDWE